MTNELSDVMRQAALRSLEERRANPPKPIDNARLPAGAPMYYYCESCGHLSDTKPEDWFLDPPKKLCGECQAMNEQGWLTTTDQ